MIEVVLAIGIAVFMIFAFGYVIGYGHHVSKSEKEKNKLYASKKR